MGLLSSGIHEHNESIPFLIGDLVRAVNPQDRIPYCTIIPDCHCLQQPSSWTEQNRAFLFPPSHEPVPTTFSVPFGPTVSQKCQVEVDHDDVWINDKLDRLLNLVSKPSPRRSNDYDVYLDWMVGNDAYRRLEPNTLRHSVFAFLQVISRVSETNSSPEILEEDQLELGLCQSQHFYVTHDGKGRIVNVDNECHHFVRLRPNNATQIRQELTHFEKRIEWMEQNVFVQRNATFVKDDDLLSSSSSSSSSSHARQILNLNDLNDAVMAFALVFLVGVVQYRWNKAQALVLGRGAPSGDGDQEHAIREPLLASTLHVERDPVASTLVAAPTLLATNPLDDTPLHPPILAAIVGIGWQLTCCIYGFIVCSFFMTMNDVLWVTDLSVICYIATSWIGPWVGRHTMAEICPTLSTQQTKGSDKLMFLLTWGWYPGFMMSCISIQSATSRANGFVLPRLGTNAALLQLCCLWVFVSLPIALLGWYLGSSSSRGTLLSTCSEGMKGDQASVAGLGPTPNSALTTRAKHAAVSRLYAAFDMFDATTARNKKKKKKHHKLLLLSRLKASGLFITWSSAPMVGLLPFSCIMIKYNLFLGYLFYGNEMQSQWNVRWEPGRWMIMQSLMLLQAASGSFLMTFFQLQNHVMRSKAEQANSASSCSPYNLIVPLLRWRWSSVWGGMAIGVYMFCYSVSYYRGKTQMTGWHQAIQFLGYATPIAITVALSCASVCYSTSRVLVGIMLDKIRKDI